jgi:hypothetical protein
VGRRKRVETFWSSKLYKMETMLLRGGEKEDYTTPNVPEPL